MTKQQIIEKIESLNLDIRKEYQKESPDYDYIEKLEKAFYYFCDELEKIVDSELKESGL